MAITIMLKKRKRNESIRRGSVRLWCAGSRRGEEMRNRGETAEWKLTKDEFLGGCKHVEGESNL